MLTTPAAASAAFPGKNGLIAYYESSDEEPYYARIFTIRPDGLGVTAITDGSASDIHPAFSADGRSIVFSRSPTVEAGERNQLFVMSADGTGQRPVTSNPTHDHLAPEFSPDGRRIVYSQQPSDSATEAGELAEIATIGSDGAGRRTLIRGWVGSPTYAPSGRRILFSGTPEGENRSGIWTVRRDGSGLSRVTDPLAETDEGSDRWPDYSPDGRWISFIRNDTGCYKGCEGSIYLVRPDGSRGHEVYGPSNVLTVFAPAGDRIATNDPGDPFYSGTCGDIYAISLTQSTTSRVTQCAQAEVSPSVSDWQPQPGPVSNRFSFDGAKQRREAVRIRLSVPGPGELKVGKSKALKHTRVRALGSGSIKLKPRLTRRAKAKLRSGGKVEANAKVTYAPDGGKPRRKAKRVRLR